MNRSYPVTTMLRGCEVCIVTHKMSCDGVRSVSRRPNTLHDRDTRKLLIDTLKADRPSLRRCRALNAEPIAAASGVFSPSTYPAGASE